MWVRGETGRQRGCMYLKVTYTLFEGIHMNSIKDSKVSVESDLNHAGWGSHDYM
jgi:hypothetical protein